ncbi:MAG: VWA domain-containing protein [Vicinamibacterales bacterium]
MSVAAPGALWLLAVPAVLAALWAWRAAGRWRDARVLRAARSAPWRERHGRLGALPAWLCLVLAAACLLGAVARPRGTATAFGRAGVDVVVLADASASMHVQDVAGGRWARAMTFLRRFGDALSWDDDRMALAAFAHIATPQIRLTRDPNTVFFFLDHLGARPPYRLEDDTTWNTDLEQAVAWGLRILDKDEELHGVSPNARVFVMLSDGEAWSGQVAKSIDRTRDARVPIFVVGVGTLAGDFLPSIPQPPGEPPVPHTISRLNRASLMRIAESAGGQYFELDRDADRDIANAIVDAGRRLAPPKPAEPAVVEFYPRLLAAAIGLAGLGFVFMRGTTELWLQAALTAVALAIVVRSLA